MEDLETVLRKVESLRRDLSAEIVIREEEGHWEGETFEGWTEGKHQEYVQANATWEIDQPRIAEPNTQKRETARTQLQQIYDSSEWYSARYQAGTSLEKFPEQMMPGWIGELRKQLNSGERKTEYVDSGMRTSAWSCARIADDIVYNEAITIIPDKDMRMKAIKDTTFLFQISGSALVKELLKETYRKNDFQPARKEAGKALDYSDLRVWAHEHPVAATLTGIATVGATSGLVYAFAEYFSK